MPSSMQFQLFPDARIVAESPDNPSHLIIFHGIEVVAKTPFPSDYPSPLPSPSPSSQHPSVSTLGITSLIPIHARLSAQARSSNDMSTWDVTCHPSKCVCLGTPVTLISTRTAVSFCGISYCIRTIERDWIEFWLEGTNSRSSTLLCIPRVWAVMPWHITLLHLALNPWLSNTTPTIPVYWLLTSDVT